MISKGFLPNFYGILEIKNFNNSRVRMEIEKIKNDSIAVENLKVNLHKIDGIKNFKILPSLGSLTVEFDKEKIELQMLIAVILKLLDLEEEIFTRRNGKIKNILSNLVNIGDIAIYNKTNGLFDMKTLIGTTLLIYGFKSFAKNSVLPAGATLIWWAYNMFEDKGSEK